MRRSYAEAGTEVSRSDAPTSSERARSLVVEASDDPQVGVVALLVDLAGLDRTDHRAVDLVIVGATAEPTRIDVREEVAKTARHLVRLEALGQLPFARVYALIAKLQAQAAAQRDPGPSSDETATPKAAPASPR